MNDNCTRGRLNDNLTDSLLVLVAEARAAYYDRHIPTTVMLAIFSVIGIPGNMIVALVYFREKRLTTSRFLIFVLAVLDSFICLVVVPENIVFQVFWLEIQNLMYCKLSWAVNYAVITPGLFLATGVAIVRYCHVCKPAKLHRIESKVKPLCVGSFVVSISSSVLIYMCTGCETWLEADPYTPGYHCGTSDFCYTSMLYELLYGFTCLAYMSCLTIISTLNFLILRRLFKQRKIMAGYKHPKRAPKSRDKVEKAINLEKQETILSASKFASTVQSSKTTVKSDHGLNMSDSQNVTSTTMKSNVSEEAKTVDTIVTTNTRSTTDKSISSKKNRKIMDRSKEKGQNNDAVNEMNSKQMETQHFDFKNRNDSNAKEKESTDTKENSNSTKNEGVSGKRKKRKHEKRKSGIKVQGKIRDSHDHWDEMSLGKENENQIESSKENKSCCKRFISMFQIESWNRTTLKLLIVTLVYFFTYTPCFIVTLFISQGESSAKPEDHYVFKYVYNPALYLTFLSSAVNPLIYTFVDPKFRTQCRALFIQKHK